MDDHTDSQPDDTRDEGTQPQLSPLDDRRAFLLKVAKGSVYAAPILRTLAAPDRLYAIDPSRFNRSNVETAPDGSTSDSPFGTSPGATPPPWSGGPPGGRGPTGREEE